MSQEEMESLTPIQKFYQGKSILITGATGFVGKVLLEKLLRSCPGINRIYLLVREKRGKSGKQRVDELFSYELFDSLRKERPNFAEKVSIVYGDLYSPSLGIKSEDVQELSENVNIIFHSAGRIKWDDNLREHVQAHIVASGDLVDMAKTFKKMEAFVYLSTGAVYREADLTVPERVGKKHVSPHQLIDALKWMNDESIQAIIPGLIKNEPMTYVLMKALTENIIEDKHGHLPTAIVRPGPVLPTYKDPFPGWCDTIQGLQGIALAVSKGFLRAMYLESDVKMWCIPVDFSVNTIIATAWHIGTKKSADEVFVVNNMLEGNKSPMLNEKFCDLLRSKLEKYPLANIYRYPNVIVHKSFFLYRIHAFFDQYLPALFIDTLIYLGTRKRKIVSLYEKVNFLYKKFLALLEKPFFFKMENFHMLCNQMSKEDSEIFFIDLPEIDWDRYLENNTLFFRKFVTKEDYSNLGYARTKAKIWWFVTSALKWCSISYFAYYISSLF